jgi:hypothetical protein
MIAVQMPFCEAASPEKPPLGTPEGALIDTIVKAIKFSIHKQKWSLLPLAK